MSSQGHPAQPGVPHKQKYGVVDPIFLIFFNAATPKITYTHRTHPQNNLPPRTHPCACGAAWSPLGREEVAAPFSASLKGGWVVSNPSPVLYCSVSCSLRNRLRGLPSMGSPLGRSVRGAYPPASGQCGVHLFPRPVLGDLSGREVPHGSVHRSVRGPPLCRAKHPRLVYLSHVHPGGRLRTRGRR